MDPKSYSWLLEQLCCSRKKENIFLNLSGSKIARRLLALLGLLRTFLELADNSDFQILSSTSVCMSQSAGQGSGRHHRSLLEHN